MAMAEALSEHPQGNAKGGYGGVFSFELKGGQPTADAFQAALKIGFVAPSLGGVETLVTRPAGTSHKGVSPEQRESIGIKEGLIRVAVGIEDTEDLVRDMLQAADQSSYCISSNGIK
ncbi:Cys/Met metabolism PLP-dependent enzyme-domain-containing protein [Dunaliella salina]|uniref:cystathionine gamma-lyase n=1 Tax=Dunaliella salina TaxID=3046 RepID=A0ABQ7FUS9_DUNSA|nr:Cys/Met metabolism PLP-dependent enzyme-domain-containing protein [Dunaliella salina]|eukprot:KAF5826058.1 Cys/Met metabolism PLP-dependent enzyme-domain-containing protein [Dunaliella salina]